MRTHVLHGSSQPNSLRRDAIYIQHESAGNDVLGIWAGSKNDEKKCIVNKAVKHTSGNYQLLAEDRYVGVDSTTGARTLTLPADADIVDGHEVIIDDEDGNAGANNITVATPGSETIAGGATATISTNDAVTRYIYDRTNTNWVAV